MNKIEIIKMLTTLDMPLDKVYNTEDVERNFNRLSLIFNHEYEDEKYSKGEKFVELFNAKQFLIKNSKEINIAILNGFNSLPQVNKEEILNDKKNLDTKIKTMNIIINVLLILELLLIPAFFICYGCIFDPGDFEEPLSIFFSIFLLTISFVLCICINYYTYMVSKVKKNVITLLSLIPYLPLIIALVFIIILYSTAYYSDYWIGDFHFDYYVYNTTYFVFSLAAMIITFISQLIINITLKKILKK